MWNRILRGVGFLALALVLLVPTRAWAFSLAAPLGIDASGNVALTGTVPVANGGTNLTTATDDNVMVGNGTTWQSKSMPACTDSGGNHLNYDASANTFSCGTSSAAGITPQVTMTSEMKMPAGTTTYYMAPGGQMSQTEAEMHTPFSSGTWTNLRCNASAAPGGTGVQVWVAKNTCGTSMTFSGAKPNVTLTAANTAVADTTDSIVTSANDCVVVELLPTGTTTTAAYIKCTMQKTSN